MLLALVLAGGCGGESADEESVAEPTTGSESIGAPVGEPAPGAGAAADCRGHTTCEPCIAAGCQWTGGMCEDTCLADVTCFGSGNPASPTCPDVQPEETTDF
jgi:hypothetical protein